MDPIAKSISEALRTEFTPELSSLQASASALTTVLDKHGGALTAERATEALKEVSTLIGGEARVQFAAEEIRAQTRRFDSLEATAIGIAAGSIAALAYFLSAPDAAKPLARTLALLLTVPFLTSMSAIGGFRVREPGANLLTAAEQRPADVMRVSAQTLEQLYEDNDRVVRRRATVVQLSLMVLVLLVFAVLGSMVYW